MTDSLTSPSATAAARDAAIDIIDAGRVEYTEAWRRQLDLHAERISDERGDTVLLLEHPSVYTAGKRTEPYERPTDGTPVIDTDRGGKITWHGPGQLVGYPIMRLADPIDVVAYVRRIELMLMRVCAHFGLTTVQVPGRSGVWVPADERGPERKIGAIGIRVSRGVTLHGFEINCDCDLGHFDAIVPCGISDAGTTSLSAELGRPVTVGDVQPVIAAHIDLLRD